MWKALTFAIVWTTIVGCAGDDIFGSAPTSTELASLDLPNPIAIQVSETLAKVFVLNSDGGGHYDTGSLAQLSFSAADTDSPTLTADRIVTVQRFGADMLLDTAEEFVFISNRESAVEADSDAADHVRKIQVNDESLTEVASTAVGPNPFGLAVLNDQELFVVSDEAVNRLSTDLTAIATIDLSEITDVAASRIEGAAIDAENGWLFVSNRNDCLLVIDTDDNSIDYCIEGPDNTGALAFGAGRLYLSEGFPASLMVMETGTLAKQNETTRIDDSTLLIGAVPLGDEPGQMALDLAHNRVFVTNTGEDTLSVIDTDLLVELTRISLDEEAQPFDVDIGTFNGVSYIFVANYASNTVSVIHGERLRPVVTFP